MHRRLSRLYSLLLALALVFAAVATPVSGALAATLFTITDGGTTYSIDNNTDQVNESGVFAYDKLSQPKHLTIYKSGLTISGRVPVQVKFDNQTSAISQLTLTGATLESGINTANTSSDFALILQANTENKIQGEVLISNNASITGDGNLTFENANITSNANVSFQNNSLTLNNGTAQFNDPVVIGRTTGMSLEIRNSNLAFPNSLTLANFTSTNGLTLANATVQVGNELRIENASLDGLSTTGTNQVLYNNTATMNNITSHNINVDGLEFGGTQSESNHLIIQAASIGINELKNSSITPSFVTMENSSVTGNNLLNNTVSHTSMGNAIPYNIELNNATVSIANMTNSVYNLGAYGMRISDNNSGFSVSRNTGNNYQLGDALFGGGINSRSPGTGNFTLGNITGSRLEILDEANLNAFTLQLNPGSTGSQNAIQVGGSVKAAGTIDVDLSSGNNDARFASFEGDTVILRGSGYTIGSSFTDYAVRGRNILFDLRNSQFPASIISSTAAVLGNTINVSNTPNSRPNINIGNFTSGYDHSFMNTFNPGSPSTFVSLGSDHRLLSGSSGTYVIGSNQPMGLRFEGDHQRVSDVVVNGSKLLNTHYTLGSGSVVLTLLPAYLETLPANGQWLPVDVYFEDGTISQAARFRVSNVPPPTEAPTAAPASGSGDGNVPKTGDGNHLGLWIALLALSLGCVIIVAVFPARKRTGK